MIRILGRILYVLLIALASLQFRSIANAEAIQWVTVGDPGNSADTAPSGYGAVATSFRLMRYEFTNRQYADFLNVVAKSADPYSLYDAGMGSDARGGITQSGTTGSYSYSVKTNMGDKPVVYVSWYDAARVANWYQNGASSLSSTETGAYTLNGFLGAYGAPAPGRNSGASFYIPTEDQWYKAAYYTGGGTNAGYWNYATQSDTAPTAVSADPTGIGSAGSTGNFANYNKDADWNSQNGNVTTVGTNGGSSAYGAFDMDGNVYEWNDLTGISSSSRGIRGGNYYFGVSYLGSNAFSNALAPSDSTNRVGFRLAGPVPPVPEIDSAGFGNVPAVPEIDPAGFGNVLALVAGSIGLLERRRLRAKTA